MQNQPIYHNQGFPMNSMVAVYEQDFLNVLTDQKLKWQKELQFAEQIIAKNNSLADTCKGNPGSLRNAIINVAAIGISLNPALKHAYLVPRRLPGGGPQSVCLDISYQGLLHLAVKEGSITWGQAKLVHKNDVYTNQGTDKQPLHEYNAFGDRGDVIGVYCTVKLPNGDYLTEEMDQADIDQVARSSAAANGPWKTWRGQMTRKAVIKRASNYWPKCELVHEAVAILNEHEGLSAEALTVTQEVTTESVVINQLLEKDPAPVKDFSQQLDECKTLQELADIGQSIAKTQSGTPELGAKYRQRRGELSHG